MTDRDIMKLALDAYDKHEPLAIVMEEVRARLAQPEPEPVAYPDGDVVGPCICGSWPGGKCLKCPRIATPPQRKPLSDEELFKIWLSVPAETEDRYAFARAVEAAHGIKE